MQKQKQIRKIKQRGAFFFVVGGLVALAGAAKLAPPVHQAKIQAIGGAYAREIASSIAQEFLLQSGAIHTKSWQLHAQASERMLSIHPRLSWGKQLPAKSKRALLQKYQQQMGAALRSYHYTPPKAKAPTPAQKHARKLLSAALRKKWETKKKQQAIQDRKHALLSKLSSVIAPNIYESLGFGKATEIAATAKTNRRKTPPPSWGWADTWVLFVLGVAVSLGGLIVWQQTLAYETQLLQKHEDTQADTQSPFVLLGSALPLMRDIQQEIESLDAKALCERVDQLLVQHILPFAEVRQKVIDRLGMHHGAEILVTVAFGERMLNRVWSAASDGHPVEARTVFPDALHAFEEAQQKIESLT